MKRVPGRWLQIRHVDYTADLIYRSQGDRSMSRMETLLHKKKNRMKDTKKRKRNRKPQPTRRTIRIRLRAAAAARRNMLPRQTGRRCPGTSYTSSSANSRRPTSSGTAGLHCSPWQRIGALEEPLLWRHIDLREGGPWDWRELPPARWKAMAHAAVEHSAGRCEPFRGHVDADVLVHLSNRHVLLLPSHCIVRNSTKYWSIYPID